MRIISMGSEIVECLRIGRMIERHGELFLQRVFTPREVRFCQARQRSMEHFAGRWAAKEAALKCLGASLRKGIGWTDMEVSNEPNGTPSLHLSGSARDRAKGLQIGDMLVTIAQCRAYATAYVLAVADELL